MFRTFPWLLLSAVLAENTSAAMLESPDEQQIRRVLEDQARAWNQGDLEAFMQGYWNSPDLTFYSAAARIQGWSATLERYRRRYQAENREMGHLQFLDVEVQILGADSAFVRGRWQLQLPTGNPGGLFTLIFKKLPEGWKIIHDHTSSDSG